MQITPTVQFDRELSIHDFLKCIDQKKLQQALAVLVGGPVCILDTTGNSVLGEQNGSAASIKIPLTIQLEPVAYLQASDKTATQGAAMLVEQILKSSERYLMASELHIEAIHADYEALQEKHAALLASEEKYRVLAQTLEQQVQEQVKTIENAHRQLYQAEKLASVGQLAAGVAHEINNPIGFIHSNLSTAQDYVEEIGKFAERIKSEFDGPVIDAAWEETNIEFTLQDFTVLLEESINGADRVTRIIADLKDFSNIDRTEEEILDINQVIRSVCNVVSNQIGQKADLVLTLEDLPVTRCRPGHMGHAFLNVLLNAATAIKQDPGEIRVETEFVSGEIVIRICDNGCGMSREVLQRIFDPFYTTRDVGEGTGLGLTVSHDIIQAHDGRIEVDSQEGEGSAFTIVLPVRE